MILVLGLLKWDRFAVVMRAATQQVRALDYVAAAEATGASTPRIIAGEILAERAAASDRRRERGGGERDPA